MNLDKLSQFDSAVKNLREAIFTNDGNVLLTVSMNHYNNTLNIAIEGTNIPNNWEQRVGVTPETRDEKLAQLSDELGNLIQDYTPDIEDDVLNELCERIATYAYNFTGNITAEDIENYIKGERARMQRKADMDHKSKLTDFKNRKYPSSGFEIPRYDTKEEAFKRAGYKVGYKESTNDF